MNEHEQKTEVSCETQGHMWGPGGKCVFCPAYKPELPSSEKNRVSEETIRAWMTGLPIEGGVATDMVSVCPKALRAACQELLDQRVEIEKWTAWSRSCDPSLAIQAVIAELEAWSPTGATEKWLRVHCLGLLRGQLPADETNARLQPYLISLLKELEQRVPPPVNCHHCITFAQFGSDSAGWTDKLALQINRDGQFVCLFLDCSDLEKQPSELVSAILEELTRLPQNVQIGVGVGQYAAPIETTASPWIPVSDRLPAYTEDRRAHVLVYSESTEWLDSQFAVMRQAEFYAMDPDGDGDPGSDDARAVSHWKELTPPGTAEKTSTRPSYADLLNFAEWAAGAKSDPEYSGKLVESIAGCARELLGTAGSISEKVSHSPEWLKQHKCPPDVDCKQCNPEKSQETLRAEKSTAYQPDRREWVILHRPGMVPEQKGPFKDSKLTVEMLRALYEQHPDCVCDVATISCTEPPEPWMESGREYLDIYNAQNGEAGT